MLAHVMILRNDILPSSMGDVSKRKRRDDPAFPFVPLLLLFIVFISVCQFGFLFSNAVNVPKMSHLLKKMQALPLAACQQGGHCLSELVIMHVSGDCRCAGAFAMQREKVFTVGQIR